MRLPAPTALLIALPLALGACGGDGDSEAAKTPFAVLEPPATSSSPDSSAPAVEPGPDETEDPDPASGLVSLDWFGGDAAYPEVPSPVAERSVNAGLRAAIEDALEGREGDYSVIVHNLVDGRYAAINPDETYYAASLFKAAVLLEVYRQRDAGLVDFAKELTLDEESAEYDLGTLEYFEIEVGDRVTLGDAVKAMVIASDTALANLVLGEVGSGAVDATLSAIGATTMSVTTTALPTTAADMTTLLLAIARGDGVSEDSRREMLNLLGQEWFVSGVLAGIPAGTPYAHKTGSFTDATHDVAIVEGPAGPYLIAVLTDRSHEWEPIAEISAAVWQYFAANP
jgi:beta-lactamase class A